MRKKRIFKKNKISPDPKYKSELVAKFVNHIMKDGKKITAYNIFYSAMDIIKEKTEQEGLEVLMTALENVLLAMSETDNNIPKDRKNVAYNLTAPREALSLG